MMTLSGTNPTELGGHTFIVNGGWLIVLCRHDVALLRSDIPLSRLVILTSFSFSIKHISKLWMMTDNVRTFEL